MIKNEKNIYYWTSAFCIDDDTIWFIYGKRCILCKYTISIDENQIIGVIPVANPTQENLFQKIILAQNKLFIIPCWANDIVVYDLTTDRFNIIKIKPCSGLKFSGAYVYKNKIVCIPASYEYVVSIDILDMKINYEYNVKRIKEEEHIDYFNITDILGKQKVILCSPQSDKIYIYDMEKQTLVGENVCTEKNGKSFEYVVCIDEQIVLCDNKKHEIITYNYRTKREEYIFWPLGKKTVAVLRVGSEIVIDDYETSWVGIFNKNFELLTEIKNEIVKNRKYYYSYLIGNCESDDRQNIYFNNCDMSFNWVQDGKIKKKVRLQMSEEDRKYIKENLYITKNDINIENYFYRLNDFLEKIILQNNF